MWKPPDDQGKVPAGRQPRCVTGSRLLLVERMRWKVSSPLVELPSLLAVPPAATRTRSRTMTRAVNAAEQSLPQLLLAYLPTTLSPHQILNSRVNTTSKTDSGTLENSLLSSLAVQCS